MVVHTRITAEEFDRIAALPENAEKRLELIGGEIVELVSNNYASEIAMRFAIELGIYIKGKNLGRITGADGGYKVSGERYIPDVAFISTVKQPQPSHEAYNPQAPDLAIEVVSPTDMSRETLDKVANYLAADTIVWLAYPQESQVKVFEPGQPVKTLGPDDVLDGGNVLPGFKLPLRDIFRENA